MLHITDGFARLCGYSPPEANWPNKLMQDSEARKLPRCEACLEEYRKRFKREYASYYDGGGREAEK